MIQIKKKFSPLIIFLSSLLWAADAPFRQPLITGGLSVPFVAFLEHAINSIAGLFGLMRSLKTFSSLKLKQWLGLIYIGAGASALGALLYVQGAVIMNYNFTVAALLQKLQPIFAIILSVIFLKEKLQPKFWAFAALALVGAYFVTFGFINPQNILLSGSLNLKGAEFAIGAALLWAGGTVVGRSLLKNLPLNLVNGMRFIFGLIFLCFYTALTSSFQFGLMTPFFWRNIVIIALVTGFFALLIYYYGLRNTKASVATLMELGYPLALTIINWQFLGIQLSSGQIVGALILLITVTMLMLDSNNLNIN